MPAAPAFTVFDDLARHLEGLGLFRILPELGRLRGVLSALAVPAPRYAVQVVGTNGKGSTSTFLESLARTQGLRTGLFTSPHFVSFRERIRLDGQTADETALLPHANAIMAAGGGKLTYFEFVTALAALVFAEAEVDLAVMETGLGGSWDAVTALPADLVLFTPIGLDHCAILGDTPAAIARDKAGAIRQGKPVISAPQDPEVLRVLREVAARREASVAVAGGLESLPETLRAGQRRLRLAGEHQHINAGLALAAWRHLSPVFSRPNRTDDEDIITRGLCEAFIPGRLQSVPASPAHGHPALLLDGAHNAHGVRALSAALAKRGVAPAAVIFSCLEDKNPAAMAAHVRILSGGPVFVPPIADNPRALSPESLADAIGLAARPMPGLREALHAAASLVTERFPEEDPEAHPVLLCGSLYLLAEFFAMRPECLEPRDRSCANLLL